VTIGRSTTDRSRSHSGGHQFERLVNELETVAEGQQAGQFPKRSVDVLAQTGVARPRFPAEAWVPTAAPLRPRSNDFVRGDVRSGPLLGGPNGAAAVSRNLGPGLPQLLEYSTRSKTCTSCQRPKWVLVDGPVGSQLRQLRP